MGFDINKFETASFKERIEVVQVPELKQFFQEGEKTEWKVRGLTASELAEANDAVSTNRNVEGVLKAIASQLTSDKIDIVKEVIGLPNDDVPNDIVRRFSMLSSGSIDPICPHSVAVKLGTAFPTILYSLTNKIIELTGAGQQLGE